MAAPRAFRGRGLPRHGESERKREKKITKKVDCKKVGLGTIVYEWDPPLEGIKFEMPIIHKSAL